MTKPCPKCSSQMIQRDTGPILLTQPAQIPWQWWCGCGHTEPGGNRLEISEDEWARREWEQAQSKTIHEAAARLAATTTLTYKEALPVVMRNGDPSLPRAAFAPVSAVEDLPRVSGEKP